MAGALAGLGLPIGTCTYIVASGQSLPDAYLVTNLLGSVPAQAADDGETERLYHVKVSYYSRHGLSAAPDVAGAMVAAGFTRGPEGEIPYNELTRQFGLESEFYFLG
jgi:hypothetical protein